MATVRNYIDVLLQAAGTRINTITLPTNVLVDTPNVATGLQTEIDSQRNVVFRQTTAPAAAVNYDIWIDTSVTPNMFKTKIGGAWVDSATVNTGIYATLSGQVNSTNYATYLGANAVTQAAFAISGSIASSDTISFNFDSGNNPVILNMTSLLESKINATSGYSQLSLNLTVNGSSVFNNVFAQVKNSTDANKNVATGARAFYIGAPGSGSLTYQLTSTLATTGDGTGGGVGKSSMQLFWLKR